MISSAIDAFPTTIEVKRTTVAIEFVDGIAQPVTSWDNFELTDCSFQPLTARERMLLPELIRDRETAKVYTKCLLRSVDVEGKLLADRVTYREQTYVVQSVQDWVPHGQFYKAVLVKENN